MTIDPRPWFAALMAGFMLFLTPVAHAQVIGAADAMPRAELYAKVKVAGFTSPVEIRQSGARTRVDMTEGGALQSYIADREKGVLISLTATGQNRIALVFPLDRADGVIPLPLDLAVLVRQATVKVVGAALVGGMPCRLIEFSNYLGQSGMICASPENVILQMTKRGRQAPLFTVLNLSLDKQDPKWFRAPPDYQTAVVPAIGGASASYKGGFIEQPQPPNTALKPSPAH